MKSKRIVASLMLAASLVLGVAAVGNAPVSSAAKTSKYTLFKGESWSISVIGIQIRSLSSSKKSVVKVKKSGSYKFKVTAKKAGKATVTVRGKNGKTLKYKFTVKAVKLSCTFYRQANSSTFIVKVKNKTGTYVPNAKVNYSLCDASGSVVEKSYFSVSDLASGSTTFTSIYVSSAAASQIAKAKKSGKITVSRLYPTTYKNATKKLSVSYKMGNNSVKIKNKTNKYLYGGVDIVFYNSLGEIVGINKTSSLPSAKGVTTASVFVPNGAVSCKVYKRASYS